MVLVGKVRLWLSLLWLVLQNLVIFDIFFVEAQEINLRGNLQGSKYYGDCIFL